MKSLVEHIAEQEDLDERLLRTGAIVTYGARSRKEGEDAVRAFKQGQQALQKGGTEVDVEDHFVAFYFVINGEGGSSRNHFGLKINLGIPTQVSCNRIVGFRK